MTEEGYVKFDFKLRHNALNFPLEFAELNRYRTQMYDAGLIGAYSNGIGFGNISMRVGSSEQFLISGTATGDLRELKAANFCKITGFDLSANTLQAEGVANPSSESLTHAAFYQARSQIHAVIHVHSMQLWHELKGKAPTTAEHVPYGTPAMAFEILGLFKSRNPPRDGLVVMSGHEDGVIAYGHNLKLCASLLFEALKNK